MLRIITTQDFLLFPQFPGLIFQVIVVYRFGRDQRCVAEAQHFRIELRVVVAVGGIDRFREFNVVFRFILETAHVNLLEAVDALINHHVVLEHFQSVDFHRIGVRYGGLPGVSGRIVVGDSHNFEIYSAVVGTDVEVTAVVIDGVLDFLLVGFEEPEFAVRTVGIEIVHFAGDITLHVHEQKLAVLGFARLHVEGLVLFLKNQGVAGWVSTYPVAIQLVRAFDMIQSGVKDRLVVIGPLNLVVGVFDFLFGYFSCGQVLEIQRIFFRAVVIE